MNITLKECIKTWISRHGESLCYDLMNESVRIEPYKHTNRNGVYAITERDDRLEDTDFIIEKVEQFGGEDMGSTYYTVYKFIRNGEIVHASFNGHYQSHYGVDYNDWYFVKPVEVTRIEWGAG